MVELKERLARMEKEMIEFSDIDGLKTRAEEKRRMLADEKEQLELKKVSVMQCLQEATNSATSFKVIIMHTNCLTYNQFHQ